MPEDSNSGCMAKCRGGGGGEGSAQRVGGVGGPDLVESTSHAKDFGSNSE